MNIVEALKLSNSVINQKLRRHIEITNMKDTRHINLTTEEIFSNDWEPILEKKKMYQALLRYENGSYYITPFLYPDEAAAKEVYNNFFVKLLTDRPIEVEATDESNV